ncbi:hypothetical protein RRF57_011611 [Xylaria bambusicola]|uniref:Uncharacterized protein n=1 Tax=Xylaria bambusicola TaxID=326684 RepID=A0AAN7Z3V0_9PEZI
MVVGPASSRAPTVAICPPPSTLLLLPLASALITPPSSREELLPVFPVNVDRRKRLATWALRLDLREGASGPSAVGWIGSGWADCNEEAISSTGSRFKAGAGDPKKPPPLSAPNMASGSQP